jgi:chromosome segregation ATPase
VRQADVVSLFFIRRYLVMVVCLPALHAVTASGAEPDAGNAEVTRLRSALANAEARGESMALENRRLNNEVKASTVALGGLQHELAVANGKLSATASGKAEESDRKRIVELEASLAQVRVTADKADAQARGEIDDLQRTNEGLKKRLAEITLETERLRSQLTVTEQTLATARTQIAAEKKRADGH